MCNGMVCFTFNLPNINELILDYKNGFYLDNDIDKTIKKINDIDDNLIKKISLEASLTVNENFNLNKIIFLEKNYIKELSK